MFDNLIYISYTHVSDEQSAHNGAILYWYFLLFAKHLRPLLSQIHTITCTPKNDQSRKVFETTWLQGENIRGKKKNSNIKSGGIIVNYK